jgi:alkaline phosphatase D
MMKNSRVIFQHFMLLLFINLSNHCLGAGNDTIPPIHKVTLPEAHIGDLEIDTKLLDSYGLLPDNIREFYLNARAIFSGSTEADYTTEEILEAARKNNIMLMGGPKLGDVKHDGVTIWLRPSTTDPFVVKMSKTDGSDEKTVEMSQTSPGVEQKIIVDGLSSATEYKYAVYTRKQRVAEGGFTTATAPNQKSKFRLAFGSCTHKIGLHNPNLINQILERKTGAMLLLGDIAVDDRDNLINMHRSDYLLRDVSAPWRQLSANIPIYAAWDDHDYLNNDLGGIPEGFTEEDRSALRAVWYQNWNNPANENPGTYFNTRIGPVEIIVLDTRSFRDNDRRGEYGSYLGNEQFKWLKETLKTSEAPFKVISSGTMWSDYITPGKDSWGTWDTVAREEFYNFIETDHISGVLLISGDRHGSRGFTIPRPSGFAFYEFEVASLGGVPGPDAMAADTTHQLFGYHGTEAVAFGELTFITDESEPVVVFRLIDQYGNILEEYSIPYEELTPAGK